MWRYIAFVLLVMFLFRSGVSVPDMLLVASYLRVT